MEERVIVEVSVELSRLHPGDGDTLYSEMSRNEDGRGVHCTVGVKNLDTYEWKRELLFSEISRFRKRGWKRGSL